MALKDFQERKMARRLLFSWPVLFGTTVLVLVAFWGVSRNVFRYLELKRDAAEAGAKVAEYEKSRKLFEERLKMLDTSQGLEKEARARFNLKKPGEEVAIFLDSDIPKKDSSLRAQAASILESVKNYFKEFIY